MNIMVGRTKDGTAIQIQVDSNGRVVLSSIWLRAWDWIVAKLRRKDAS